MENEAQVVFVTGVLGSGKTGLLISLLDTMAGMGLPDPAVVVNDKGQVDNIDYRRVSSRFPSLVIMDLMGECLGCDGKETVLRFIREQLSAGKTHILIEPTGLINMKEIAQIANELTGCAVSSIHLVPANKAASAMAAGFDGLYQCRVIGVTHAYGNVTSEVQLLSQFFHKPVEVLEQDPDREQVSRIWEYLTQEVQEQERATHRCGSTCATHGCSHGHGADRHHHHHRDGDETTTTFSTEGWRVGELLGYLMSLGDGLVRFKGVVQTEDDLLLLQFAQGRWGQEKAADGSLLKADLFTRGPVEPPKRVAFTDQMIDQLMEGIPPVLIEHPTGEKPSRLATVGPNDWRLLYEEGKRGSAEVQQVCGEKLAARCREAAQILATVRYVGGSHCTAPHAYVTAGDRVHELDHKLINEYRLEVLMLWLFWASEFSLTLASEDQRLLGVMLADLEPSQINRKKLVEGWVWDGGPDFQGLLTTAWPERSETWTGLFSG